MLPRPPNQKTLDAFCGRQQLPALALGIFSRVNSELFCTGAAEPGSGFPIASLTKTFTADWVLRLAARGVLDLDAPLSAQLPDFGLADPDAAARMTPRDALCHFSGLPPHTRAWVYGDLPRADYIRERLPHLAAAGPFRERHRYSNLLYAVLGALGETCTGQSWEEMLAAEIVQPLGLRDTTPLEADWTAHCALPHAAGADGPLPVPPFFARKNHLIAPASELRSSLRDLIRWGQQQMELPSDDVRWHPHCPVTGPRPHPALGALHYGLGWRLDQAAGGDRVWHSGQCGGFSSLLVLRPQSGRGLVALTNREEAVDALQALDLWIHHGIDPDTWPAPKLPPPSPEIFPLAAEEELSAGIYSHPGYGTLRLQRDSDGWRSVFQDTTPLPLGRDGKGQLRLRLPCCRSSFPLHLQKSNCVAVSLEPALPPILFHRGNGLKN